MPKVFVSYSHTDSDFVNRLCSDLSTEHEVAVDKIAIVPDVPLIQQISAYIDTRDFFIPVISHTSVKSPWVEREIALAFERSIHRGISIIPVIIDDVGITSLVAHIPYVQFSTSDDKHYMDAIVRLLALLRRSPVVSGHIVLRNFSVWGSITSSQVGDFGVVLKSSQDSLGASGLVYDHPVHLTGFSKIVIHIEGSHKSDFTGFRPHSPKMLKLQIDDRPILAANSAVRSDDDPTFVLGHDGDIEYGIPTKVRERGYLKKLELVFGRGHINDLHVDCRIL